MESVLHSLVPFALVSSVGYLLLIFYRIYLSPLASIPGPKLAAASGWYECYFDCFRGGKYVFEVERLHRVYGPIVRIAPSMIHINDPEFFDKLYNMSTKLDKDPWYYALFNRSGSTFSTFDSELHKLRRGTLNKFFSSASISKLSPLLVDRVGKLCSRMEEFREDKKPVPLSDAFRCLATDIISEYAVLKAATMLEYPDFGRAHAIFMRTFSHLAIWNRHFPFILPLFDLMPRSVIAAVDEGPGLALFDGQVEQQRQAALVVENDGSPPLDKKSYPVIMNEVYRSELPAKEKSPLRLFHEVAIIIGAGAETTGNTLALTTYYILKSPERVHKLRAEVTSMSQDKSEVIDFKKLESLPYLNACIQEGLRLATGVSGRLPRINRLQATHYRQYTIPAGTPISMTIRDMHMNPEIFKDPATFDETRWLGKDKQELERYLVPFSKGSRGCVGQNLAMAELRMAIANLFARFEMELFKTSDRDVVMSHDFFAPYAPADSKGLQVLVK